MGYNDYGVEESKSSKFNAGQLQTLRVDKILQMMNHCKNNLSAFNIDLQEWNYNLYKTSIDSLFDEIEAWTADEESKSCINMSNNIEKLMDANVIHENVNKRTGRVKELQEIRLKIFKKALREYERLVRKLGVKYAVIAATKDDDLEGL